MEVTFLASGERVAVLDTADFEGKTAKAVKQTLAAEIGVSRFKQRPFGSPDLLKMIFVFPICLYNCPIIFKQ